jgi:site-specific DNA recombinase
MPKQNSKGETAVSSRVNMSDLKTAAIYLRRSAVDGSGEDISITYQREACEGLAKGQGLQIVRIFNEGDGQAASIFKNNERPEYEAALLGLGREYKTLIAYSVDRLSRKGMTSVGQMLELAENQDGRIITNDGLDTDQSSSRLVASFMGELAYAEVKKTSERVSAAKEQKRKKGAYTGGDVPFGFRLVRHLDGPSDVVIDQKNASLVKEMVERYLEGGTLRIVAKWLDERGVPSPKSGGLWTHHAVSRVLTNPAIIGYRRYGGQGSKVETHLYSDEEGNPIRVLEPIISDSQFYRVQKRLKDNNQRASSTRNPSSRTLLGGMMKCATSGERLLGSRRKNAHGTRLKYQCGCGQHEGWNSVFETDAEPYVVRSALLYLAAQDPESLVMEEIGKKVMQRFSPEQLGKREDLEGELLKLESRKSKLVADYYRDGKISEEDFEQIESQLSIKINTVTAELRTLPPAKADLTMLLDLTAAGDDPDDLVGPGSAWDQLEDHLKKSILMCLVEEITVTHVDRQGNHEPPKEWSDMDHRLDIQYVKESNVVDLSSRTTDKLGRIKKIQKKATA